MTNKHYDIVYILYLIDDTLKKQHCCCYKFYVTDNFLTDMKNSDIF